MFQKFKLWFVRKLKNWNTCSCRYHMELKAFLNGFNDMRTPRKGIHTNYNYKCIEVCHAP
jgi:hypothetical protein